MDEFFKYETLLINAIRYEYENGAYNKELWDQVRKQRKVLTDYMESSNALDKSRE